MLHGSALEAWAKDRCLCELLLPVHDNRQTETEDTTRWETYTGHSSYLLKLTFFFFNGPGLTYAIFYFTFQLIHLYYNLLTVHSLQILKLSFGLNCK
jgi:hypothetical protein